MIKFVIVMFYCLPKIWLILTDTRSISGPISMWTIISRSVLIKERWIQYRWLCNSWTYWMLLCCSIDCPCWFRPGYNDHPAFSNLVRATSSYCGCRNYSWRSQRNEILSTPVSYWTRSIEAIWLDLVIGSVNWCTVAIGYFSWATSTIGWNCVNCITSSQS